MRKRKKFNKLTRIGNKVLPPHELVLLKTMSRPMTEDEIEKCTAPIVEFQAALKAGTANRQGFNHLIDSGYHCLHLLELLLEEPSLSSDKDYDQQCRDDFARIHIQITERLTNLILAMNERFKRTGKYGATAEDHITIENLRANFHNLLEFVDFKHYFISLQKSQSLLADVIAGRGVKHD